MTLVPHHDGARLMSRSSRLLATLLAPVVALLIAPPSSVVPTATAARTATISGTVTGPGGAVLPGIEVTAYRHANEAWRPVASARTDRAGRYQVTVLVASAAYQLGFTDTTGDYIAEYFGDAATFKTSTHFPVTRGATVSGMDAELALAGHVRGTVTDTEGAPLVSVTVLAFQRIDYFPQWFQVAAVNTDASGGYDLGGLKTGKARIEFDRTGLGGNVHVPEFYDNAATFRTATDVLVTAGVTTSVKTTRLLTGSHITGTVTGEGGVALAGVSVTAYQWDRSNGWAPVAEAETGGDGGYDLRSEPIDGTLISAGTYRVGFQDHTGAGYADEFYGDTLTVEDATDISVTAAGTASGHDVELAPRSATPSSPTATPTATPPPTPAATPSLLPVAGLVATLLAATIGVIAIRRRRDWGVEGK